MVGAERIEGVDLLRREAPVSDHLEVSNRVARAFADGDIDQSFAFGAVDDQGVLEDSEVDVAATRVQLGNFLSEVLRVLRIVELAVARPEKSLWLCVHGAHDVGIGDLRVAVDADSRDRETPPFIDSEIDRELPVCDGGFGLYRREIVSPAFVKRVDAGDRLCDLARIDGTAGREGQFLLHILRRYPVGADNLVVG